MAEAERAAVVTTQPEQSKGPEQPANSIVHSESEHLRLRRAKLKVAGLATMGAAFGSMVGTTIFGEIFSNEHDKAHLGEFLIVAAIIGAAAFWFFDPLMELVQGWMGLPPREVPEERRIVTTIAVVTATLVIAILHHSLASALEHVTPVGFVILILFFGGTAGVTTYYWTQGATRQPPRAAAYGAKSGTLGGALAGFIVVFAVIANKTPSASQWMTASNASFLLSGTTLWAFLTLLLGLLGGLAIEKEWDKKSPTRGVLTAMLAFSGVSFFIALVVGQLFPKQNATVWLIGLQAITLSLGWALGPFLHRESCDRVFGVSGASAEAINALPQEFRRSGTVVVPIDSGRSAASGSAPASEAASQSVSPTILLLQPKGSRAWALAILIVALAIGAWAYATGAIRTDSEIVSEIVGKFAHDSGLNEKFLTAASAQHVVTVSGMVDNGLQHTAAVEHASSVRGVKQVIDQIQLAPPQPAKPNATVVAQQPAQGATINANISIGKSGATNNQVNAVNQRQRSASQHPAAQPKQQQQKRGLFHWFKKNKNSSQN